jgi:hypothetical protein
MSMGLSLRRSVDALFTEEHAACSTQWLPPALAGWLARKDQHGQNLRHLTLSKPTASRSES